MFTRRKRTISVFTLIFLGMLTGCGGDETTTSASQTEESAAPRSVLEGQAIIDDAEAQVQEIMAGTKTRIDEAVNQAQSTADQVVDETEEMADELEEDVRNQLRNFDN